MGWGLGKLQKEGQQCEGVVGKGEEEVQARESDMMSGEECVQHNPNVRLATTASVCSCELATIQRNAWMMGSAWAVEN